MPPLQKQIVEFPFGLGLDTKADSKAVKPPKLAGLENARLVNNETVNKRFGTSAIGPNGDGTLQIAKLFQYGGETLGATLRRSVSGGDEALVHFDTYQNKWTNLTAGSTNQRFPCSFSSSVVDVTRDPVQVNCGDSATLGNYTLYIWERTETTGPSIYYSVIDRTTGETLLKPTNLAAANVGLMPRAMAVNGKLLLAYATVAAGNKIKVFTLNSDFSTTLTVTTTIAINTSFWDWTPYGNDMIIAYANAGGANALTLERWTTAGSQVGLTVSSALTATNALAIGTCNSGSEKVRVFAHDNTNGLRASVFAGPGITGGDTPWVLDSSTSPVVRNITAINDPVTNTKCWCLAEVNAASSYNAQIKCFLDVSDGSASPGSTVLRSVGLASKLIIRDTALPSFAAVYDTSLQATFFLFDLANPGNATQAIPEVRAKVLSTAAGGLTKRQILPNLSLVTSNTLAFVGPRKTRVVSLGNSLTTFLGLSELSFQFSSSVDDWPSKATAAPFSGDLLFSGGILGSYDGLTLLESGFLVYPEIVSAAGAAAGGHLNDGTYTYAVTYEYVDYQGNLVESTPSVQGTFTISGGSGNGSCTVVATTYRLGLGFTGSSPSKPRNVSVVLWLSDANTPNTLYRATDPLALVANDPTSDSVSLIIGAAGSSNPSNATLVGRQALYTTGGVLPNYTPDGPTCMANFGKNLVIDDPNDPTILRYSKLDTAKYGPHFASQFTIPVFSDGGRAVALIQMDGRLFIFKKRQIWYCYGTGLDDLGGGQGFSVPQKLRDDIGCAGPQLLCETPQGILFSSTKGIWLLRRDLSVTYAGAAVETYNTNTIRSFVHLKDSNEVRILLNDGTTTLVYNYYWTDDQGVGQWWTDTSYSGSSATVDGNGVYTFAHLTGNGFAYAYKENSSGFVDNHITAAPFITEKITTGWYALAGKQGYQRVFSILLLGLLKDTHSLKVEIAYDYETSFSETHTITSANLTSNSSNYQGRIFPTRQRCQAIQLRISDISQNGTGESMTLTGVAFEIGALPGAMRLPAAKSG